MIRINLLPVRAERKKQTLQKQLTVGILTVVLVVAVCGYIQFFIITKISRVSRNLKRTQQEIAALKPVIDKINHYKQQKDEINKKIAVINNLDSARLDPIHTLHDLNLYKPAKLWFTQLNKKGSSLNIKGISIDNETIVNFLDNLKQSRPLKQSELIYLKSHKIQDLELKEFLINSMLTSVAATKSTSTSQSKGD
ncbi:MAG: PilN domain-containing protein [Pseudomonadota bacterium]|nr:PilN domain-containing protein [Pseudomonadota bacterium]